MGRENENSQLWLRPIFAFILIPVLALLLNLPYLSSGYILDDVLMYNAIMDDPEPYLPLTGGWANIERDGLKEYWWADEGFSAGFLRPLPSFFVEGFIRTFGKNAAPIHLLSIILHALVGVLLYQFARKLSGNNGLALLAGLIFITCEDNSMTVGWMATITDLFCVLFIMLSMFCHSNWLERRKPIDLAGSLFALLLSLLCKETAVIAPIALLLMTFIMPKGNVRSVIDDGTGRKSFSESLSDYISWVPSLVIMGIYLVIYFFVWDGRNNNLLYFDPFSEPGKYLSHLALHLPVMWLGTFSPFLINFAMFMTWMIPVMAAAGLIIFIGWLFALLPMKKNPLVLWAIITYIVALLPQMGTDAGSRGLYFPLIPASILIALVVLSIGPFSKRIVPHIEVTSRWTKFVGWAGLLGLLIPGFMLTLFTTKDAVRGLTMPGKDMESAVTIIEEGDPERVVILNASNFLLTLYTGGYIEFISGKERDVSLLSAGSGVFTLERTGESSFVIRDDREGWLSNFVARVIRVKEEFEVGQVYEKEFLTATILQTTEDRKDVLAVRFDFVRELDDPDWLFLRWDGEKFVELDFSGVEIGGEVFLGDTSDVFKTMH